ncbi:MULTISPECIES: thiamine pyrophosphate-dependent enzyme [Rhodococcus]|uniref:Thiamine pyrophosphate-dependent enzyme n=1 Tax=Rhodococcus cerastii TaxID=908616 RepID=A0ABU4CU97_9NOCA|nr:MULTISPECIES: thiamine pyrophosphate-dependent enzyme [Rhodococcus]MDV6301034.1 thiamine pyrophosphate-dependent enzyme [Rhodococcus cerastii]MDV7987452.1 thiamine pyrophosphate-dependent enzyme [Rhodococcus sp. IEGM 1374]
MAEAIDEYFLKQVRSARNGDSAVADPDRLLRYFDAQLASRHLDFAARWLQSAGFGYYTIGSSGHEANAAVGAATTVTDPALLHYRSGGFYAARAQQYSDATPIRDVLASLVASTGDPMSGGRHKVFGHPDLGIVPQTSTIGSQVPRAVGLAFALGRAKALRHSTPWPEDAIVVCSFGDASANHSTTVGALNSAAYCAHQSVPMPILFVCEDNGIGISTRSPRGWIAQSLGRFPSIEYVRADGHDPDALMHIVDAAVATVRTRRRPVVLHLETVRLMGHAGSDAELAYRTNADIVGDYARDPLLATARTLIGAGVLSAVDVEVRYEAMRETVMAEAEAMVESLRTGASSRLATADAVMAPLTERRPVAVAATEQSLRPAPGGPHLTLAAMINRTLTDIMAARPDVLVFGEDVAVKGGVYGVTKGLRKKFGAARVFDTLLDEQTVLGTALGAALAGFVPIPEIQYLAYLHNAEDQLRGEAASLEFFSDSQFANGMVVRIAGLAYQRGFGGHFHNDNAVAVLRDIPGVVVAVPSSAAEAAGLLRTCVALAVEEGRVCVFLEPIALYHRTDLDDGDGALRCVDEGPAEFGTVATHGDGMDLAIVTFGNGVVMSRRAASRLRERGIGVTVVDVRWIVPLPSEDLLHRLSEFDRVLIADETRHDGGVGEGVVTALVEGGYDGAIGRVSSANSFVPLGAAADLVLLSEDQIVAAAVKLIEVE